jgi:hypothetical protein
MKPLIFKHYDHAVMFKSLNNLSRKYTPKFIDTQRSVLMDGSTIGKLNTNGLINQEWLLKG